jgi:hypothetical protein
MGAFFLYRDGAELALNDAGMLFKRKGFPSPQTFTLGNWRLWLYRKILVNIDNYIADPDGISLFASGTIVYRGLGYRDSLKKLLSDFRSKQLDQNELLGGFCLLFWDGHTISFLLDRSLVYHIFDNDNKSCVSSSFLSVLEASPKPLPLNRIALSEKLSTGYLVAPDTLVEGIRQINQEIADTYCEQKDGICFLPPVPRPSVEMHKAGIADSIERQVAKLKTHFRAMDALHNEAHGELGLSSGYDSRLLLACSKYLTTPLELHTHKTQGVHDEESEIVKKIASSQNLKLTQVITHRMEEHNPAAIKKIIEDGLLFYDGRCSHNMGAFSETYTRAYKVKTLGAHRLGWNGLGGEMYRNYYFTSNKTINLRQWLDLNVYYPFAKEAVGDVDLYEIMHRNKVQKIVDRLGGSSSTSVDFLWLRRYYSEVRMPDCDATNSDALNQLAFFDTPFMDTSLVAEALAATPYIGCDGAYQARLIRTIDPKLAEFMTHYGHNLINIPLSKRLRSWIKGQVPLTLQSKRIRSVLRSNAKTSIPEFKLFESKVPLLAEIREAFCAAVPNGQYDDAMIEYAQRPTTIFIGSFLHLFKHKIRL